MKKTWENDSCEAVQSYFTVYRVPVAAALWCGIEPGEVEEHLALSTEVARGVLKHPYINCLEPRCRAIQDAIVTGLLLLVFHRDWFDFQAWYASLFPVETQSRVTQLYELLLRRQRQQRGTGVESFADVLSGHDSAKKRLVIGLLTRHFRPGFAPALKQALADTDPSVRTQAATAVATIEGRFLARVQHLNRKVRERPRSFKRRQKLARHYDDYAFTGLLDAERERDNRIRALEGYQEALAVRSREPALWLAIGRILVREHRHAAAAEWFAVAETRGLLSPDMMLWQMEALFQLGRYERVRTAMNEYRQRFKADGKHPPQLPGVLNLWASEPAATEAHA